MLTKDEVLDILRTLGGLQSPVWLAGGVVADFHARSWTRDHGDIDLVSFGEYRDALRRELTHLGFAQADDAGWITRWTLRGRPVLSVAYEQRVDDTTGRLVIRPEDAGATLVSGIYPGVPGNLDPSRYGEVDGVRFRVVSAADEWVFTKGYRAFRPGVPHRPSVEHNLRLLESVLPGEERERLRPLIARREPLQPASGEVRLATCSDPRDVVALQRLASRLWPLGLHPGGLGWSMATDQLGDEAAVFVDGDDVLGFAAVPEPGLLLGQGDPARPDVAAAVVAWFLQREPSRMLRTDVADDDGVYRRAVSEAGFVPEDAVVCHMRCDATLDVPAPPHGYTVRNAEPPETEARIRVHRAAWDPHALPWHASHRPAYPPDAASGHNATTYERVRRAWLYDPALDLVAVAPDGSFAGSCIVWLDERTATAEIEPLGVVPEHRNRGVAGALCHEATRRVAAAGGRELFINMGPNAAYPAPAGAYAKAGFEVVARGRTYTMTRPQGQPV